MKYPNAKKHQHISFVKSALRLAGYIILPMSMNLAVLILVISEILGIIEELV